MLKEFKELCNYSHHLVLEHFYYLEKKPYSSYSSFTIFPPPRPKKTTNLVSIYIDLPVLDILGKWIHAICGGFKK